MAEKQKGISLYYQILEYLKDKIESCEWEQGTQIPTEAILAEHFKVSRATVRRAISELVNNGSLIRKQGTGTFVARPPYEGDFIRLSLPSELGNEHKVISISQGNCKPSIAKQLNLEPNDLVTEVYRIRYIKGEPAILERTYINSAIFPEIEKEDLSQRLYIIARKRYGFQLAIKQISIEPVITNQNEATLLEIKPGSPILLLSRLWTQNEKPLMLTKLLVRSDICKILITNQ